MASDSSINSSEQDPANTKQTKVTNLYSDNEEVEHMVNFEGSQVPLKKVLHAYAGLARAGDYYAPSRNLPSMAPVGLIGFGAPSFLLGLILIGVRGITIPNYSILSGWFSGGVGLLTASLWEFVLENTHGSTVCGVYALYWWSMASMYTPSFGVADRFMAYATENVSKMPAIYTTEAEWVEEMMTMAFGYWSLGYTLFAFMVVSTLLKSTVAFFTCLLFVFCIFLVITIGYLSGTVTAVQVAGGFSCAAGIAAIYNGMAGIMTKENSYVTLKPIYMPKFGSSGDEESRPRGH